MLHRDSRWDRRRSPLVVLCVLALLAAGLAACGNEEGSSNAAATGKETGPVSKCGLGNGKKATGAPIRLGAIITKQPGTDFTDISEMAKAYFDCVNDNGGINGRPVKYIPQPEQTNPQQVASLATKLLQNEHVLGLVGSSSLIDCAVNQKLYEREHIYVIAAGIARECYFGTNVRDVNMGPYFSTLGAAQYLVRQHVKSIVSTTANVPGAEFNNLGAVQFAKKNGIPGKSLTENVPITDGAGLALKFADAAGDGGGVILDFTPPEALKVLQGAQQQGLIDKVKWACATPCNDASILKSLGQTPQWDGKLGINAELNLVDANGPDTRLYQHIAKKYTPDTALGSFSQMGFVAARLATHALLGIKGDITKSSVNQAFRGIKDFKTDILCKPWSYGKGQYLANYADRTITIKNNKFVQLEGCFDIAAVPSNFLGEQQRKLTSGS
jgi:branched-chain amino acid transport system substrate-binding protein